MDGLFSYVENKGLVPSGLSKLDVCANKHNKKCERFITEQQDTLVTPWGEGNLCWLNPPYSNVQPFLNKAVAEIHTLEGTMQASYGDYIVKGVQGEFYPCKPDIFEQTYEEAESTGGNEEDLTQLSDFDLAAKRLVVDSRA